MKWPRLSILGLIAGIVACGVAFAALREGSSYWLSAFYTITVALLLGAVVASRYRRGTSRAFWFGFAVFGWGMFFVGTNPWANQDDTTGGGLGQSINPNLLTTRAIQYLVVRVRMGTFNIDEIDEITANTIGIVHLLAVLAIATLGGLIALVMKTRARKMAAGPSRHPNVIPSLIVLTGLSSAGLAGLVRPPITTSSFPDASYRDGIDLAWRASWFSKILRASGEPSLWQLSKDDPGATALRFLWVPTFDHPICIRIVRGQVGAMLRATALDGLGGYTEGQLAIEKTVELDEGQWAGLERRLEDTMFWTMPTVDRAEEGMTDGENSVVEGVREGRYHVVDRKLGNDAFITLCRAMFDLSGLQTGKPGR